MSRKVESTRTKRAKVELPKFNGRRPTINDVARLARVSKKTGVARHQQAPPFVKEKMREQVDKIGRRDRLYPDRMARGSRPSGLSSSA